MKSLIDQFREMIARNFLKEGGCPWMKEQTWHSIARYSLEEVYELKDAITREDDDAIKSELADLCLHLVIYSELANQQDAFSWDDIVQAAIDKQRERRDGFDTSSQSSVEAHQHWNRKKNLDRLHDSVLFDIPDNFPPLMTAEQLSLLKKNLGLSSQSDHPLVVIKRDVMDLEEVCETGSFSDIEKILGRLLSSCTVLAENHGISADAALTYSNRKQLQSLHSFEQFVLCSGKKLRDLDRSSVVKYWKQYTSSTFDNVDE